MKDQLSIYLFQQLRLIVTSDEGCITVIDALNGVHSLDFKMTKTDASQLIHQDWLMSDKWLLGVRPLYDEPEDGVSTPPLLIRN